MINHKYIFDKLPHFADTRCSENVFIKNVELKSGRNYDRKKQQMNHNKNCPIPLCP